MKILLLVVLFALAGIATAEWTDPNDLKIAIHGPYTIVLEATQNQTTGIWTVAYIDSIDVVAKIFVSNETGYVRIT